VADSPEVTAAKRAAGEAAVDACVRSGMAVGLGTGSTAVWGIRRIGDLLAAGTLTDIVGIPTSDTSAALAVECGIPLTTFDQHPVLDVTVDGADEVDPALDVIKGGGGAHLREKLVAQASRRLSIVVDAGKLVPALGTGFALPVEVLQMARVPETRFVEGLGYPVEWRHRDGAPFVTDEGNWILDVRTGPITDKDALLDLLLRRAGIVEVGLFLDLTTDVFVAHADRVQHLTRAAGPEAAAPRDSEPGA
jgi:ribose 5-phosphate isomerase A